MTGMDNMEAMLETRLSKICAPSDCIECGEEIDSASQIKGRDTCARCAPTDTHD